MFTLNATTLLASIIVGSLAGWAAGEVSTSRARSFVGCIVVGITGALIAGILVPVAHIDGARLRAAVDVTLNAAIGSSTLLMLMHLARRR